MARVNYLQTKSPTWFQAVYDMVSSELTAHGAYTLVETVNSPGGMPCAVFKASGAQSRLGRDYYIYMARTVANPTVLYFATSEGYDSTAKAAIRPAPGTNRNTTVPGSDFSYGNGTAYSLWTGTTGSTLNTADIYWKTVDQAGAIPTDCWIVTTRDGFYLWGQQPGRTNGTYQYCVSVMTIEPLQSNDPGILVISDWLGKGTAGTPGGVSTRHPTITTAQSSTWCWLAPAHADAAWTPVVGQVNGAGDRFFNGRPVGGRRLLRTDYTGANLSTYGDLRGLWPGLLCIPTSGGGNSGDTVMPGETMTIYDQQGVGSSYIYAYRYGSAGVELWVNTSVP